MKKLTGFKRAVACMAAVLMCASVFSGEGIGMINADRAQAASSKLNENQENIDDAKSKIDELIAKQEELDKKIADTKDDINAEKENKEAIEEQILTVQETILALSGSISQTKDEIAALESSIAVKEIQVGEKREEIVAGVGDFKVRLKAMYVAGSNSYSDIIVGATDFYDMLMKMELVKRVAEHDDKMIEDLITLKDQYEADEAELNAEKAELEAKQADLESKKEAHVKQRDKLQELFDQSEILLDQMAEDQRIYENNLAIIEQEKEEFEKDLDALYKERQKIKAEEKKKADEEKARQEEERRKEEERRQREEAERQKQEEEERRQQEEQDPAGDNDSSEDSGSGSDSSDSSNDSSDTDDSSDGGDDGYIPPTPSVSQGKNEAYGYVDKSRFTWPVPGHYNISFGFGYRNAGVLSGNHGGIDIYDSSIRGAEMVAADEGTVIAVQNYCVHDYAKSYSCGCGGGYGRYCIVEHSDGYWTLYGHSSNIIVSVGQHVEKEQVLGYVGSTGQSTGPHTHFEVRLNNVRLDPSGYV